jgi:hypothetical protein
LEAERLYRYLKAAPRDGRWLLRRVGPDFPQLLDELRRAGRPVDAEWGEIEGRCGVFYRAADQHELFPPNRGNAPGRG